MTDHRDQHKQNVVQALRDFFGRQIPGRTTPKNPLRGHCARKPAAVSPPAAVRLPFCDEATE